MRTGRKGFTIVELMVAMALAAILGVSLITVVAPIYRTYQRTLQKADALLVAGNMLDSIRKGAARAKAVVPDDAGTGVDVGNGVYATSANGQLIFQAKAAGAGSGTPAPLPVYDNKYYDGKSIALGVTAAGTAGQAVNVTVTVSNQEGALCSIQGAVSSLRAVVEEDLP